MYHVCIWDNSENNWIPHVFVTSGNIKWNDALVLSHKQNVLVGNWHEVDIFIDDNFVAKHFLFNIAMVHIIIVTDS